MNFQLWTLDNEFFGCINIEKECVGTTDLCTLFYNVKMHIYKNYIDYTILFSTKRVVIICVKKNQPTKLLKKKIIPN